MVDLSSAYVRMEPTRESGPPEGILTGTRQFFGDDTPLKAISGNDRSYEPRPQQVRMAETVAIAFEHAEHLCVEAPTGIGKSFAYLVPGILHAQSTGRPTVISTETIALQEQLVHKDIPFLQQSLKETPFRAALAKGRHNYLCQRRLRLALAEGATLPGFVKPDAILELERWANNTSDGSLSSYPNGNPDPALWDCVCSEGGNCAYPNCGHAARCFYWRARKSWNNADILVVNHALLFTDLKMQLESGGIGESLLPSPGALVIDEAHAAEDAAAGHLGIHVSESGLHYGLARLYDSRGGRGILASADPGRSAKARTMSDNLQVTVTAFFDSLRKLYKQHRPAEAESVGTEGETFVETQLRLLKPIAELDTLSDPLIDFADELKELATALRETGGDEDDIAMEIMAQSLRFEFYSETIRTFMEQSAHNHVYWLVQARNARSTIILRSAPVTVGELLREHLFGDRAPPTLLTSATLTVNDKFDYFRQRTGFHGQTIRLDSPFDFNTQLTLHIPREMPEPNSPLFADKLPEMLRHYIGLTGGSAFVLFTSYTTMRKAYAAMQEWFAENEIFAMMQGEELGRSQMLELFRRKPGSVIFGTSSFWTGVDVPGNALTNVIIVRLPFPVPSEPLIQARCERIESRHGNSFNEYSVPEAVIRFRQGAGRLIRSKTDHGILVVLDPRILSKFYGKSFLRSIPHCPLVDTASPDLPF